jgi:hypothetical protein
VGERLKNAISDALAYPENISNINTKKKATHTLSVGAIRCTSPKDCRKESIFTSAYAV